MLLCFKRGRIITFVIMNHRTKHVHNWYCHVWLWKFITGIYSNVLRKHIVRRSWILDIRGYTTSLQITRHSARSKIVTTYKGWLYTTTTGPNFSSNCPVLSIIGTRYFTFLTSSIIWLNAYAYSSLLAILFPVLRPIEF